MGNTVAPATGERVTVLEGVPGPIPPAELPIVGEGADARAYHLDLRPRDLADFVIIVGDPERVSTIAERHIVKVQARAEHRGLRTVTGTTAAGTRITVTTSGMGGASLEIVFNELVALHEIDLATMIPLIPRPAPLTVIRLGTSGALRADTPLGTAVISACGVGLDATGLYYDAPGDKQLDEIEKVTYAAICKTVPPGRYSQVVPFPYAARADPNLVRELEISAKRLNVIHKLGVTASAGGFFANQGRRPIARMRPTVPDVDAALGAVDFAPYGIPWKLENMEMEAAALFHLGACVEYPCAAVCLTVAQRVEGTFLPGAAALMEAAASVVVDAIDRIAAIANRATTASQVPK
jgi:uridine phosphorylase